MLSQLLTVVATNKFPNNPAPYSIFAIVIATYLCPRATSVIIGYVLDVDFSAASERIYYTTTELITHVKWSTSRVGYFTNVLSFNRLHETNSG